MKQIILALTVALTTTACAPEKRKDPVPELTAAIAKYAPARADYATELEFVTELTNFVHMSSKHEGERPSFYGYLQTELYLDVVASYLNGKGELPYLQCGDRAAVLIALLGHYGIKARLLNVYNETGGGHMYLDWFSLEHGKWLVTDPDFNVRYEDNSGNPLSLAEMITLDPVTEFAPVGIGQGTGSGWTFLTYDEARVSVLRDENLFSVGFNWNTLEADINSSRIDENYARNMRIIKGKVIHVH